MVPILAKILEKFVSEQLGDYLETNSLLHSYQGAYRCGRNTEEAVDQIVHSLDIGNAVCAAFLDFHKAFDSLDHYVLLNRPFYLNLSLAVFCWFQNYLSHILHHVKGTGTFSEWRPMRGRIPQGSALGPLLFLVYLNNLPSVITSGVLLQYADDTTLICSVPIVKDVASKMHCQLMLISQWTSVSKN